MIGVNSHRLVSDFKTEFVHLRAGHKTQSLFCSNTDWLTLHFTTLCKTTKTQLRTLLVNIRKTHILLLMIGKPLYLSSIFGYNRKILTATG